MGTYGSHKPAGKITPEFVGCDDSRICAQLLSLSSSFTFQCRSCAQADFVPVAWQLRGGRRAWLVLCSREWCVHAARKSAIVPEITCIAPNLCVWHKSCVESVLRRALLLPPPTPARRQERPVTIASCPLTTSSLHFVATSVPAPPPTAPNHQPCCCPHCPGFGPGPCPAHAWPRLATTSLTVVAAPDNAAWLRAPWID